MLKGLVAPGVPAETLATREQLEVWTGASLLYEVVESVWLNRVRRTRPQVRRGQSLIGRKSQRASHREQDVLGRPAEVVARLHRRRPVGLRFHPGQNRLGRK